MAAMTRQPGPWAKEASGFLRAFSGAYLFGMPLLYTMEMWWIGATIPVWQLLVFLSIAFVANLGLNYFAGFKKESSTFVSSLNQAVDTLAVGAVAAAVTLLILNRLTWDDSPASILGKIVVQTVPLSIGASVANLIFTRKGGDQDDREADNPNRWRIFFNDLGGTLAGGVFIGFSIAPTEEVPMLAAELNFVHLLGLIALSLVVTYIIVFASGFDPNSESSQEGIFQDPFTETVLAYALSLLVSLGILFMFNQIESGDTLLTILTKTLVLGLPISIGGAAGRLAI